MSKKETVKRYIMFLIGLFVMSLGTAVITRAGLGTSPNSSIPYVLSLKFAPSLGVFTIFFNTLLVVLQILLLRKKFRPIQLLQIPVSMIFGVFVDGSMALLSAFVPSLYAVRIAALVVGCLILALGVTLEVTANVLMLSGEAFVKALSDVLHKDFSSLKVAVDASLTILSCVLSFVLFGSIQGVREGTIISALTVGLFAKFWNKRLTFLPALQQEKGAEAAPQLPQQPAAAPAEGPHVVITIAREFGSGGHLIGEKIAQRLGINFYDSQLISLVAEESGLTPEIVAKREEKMTNSFLYDLVMQNYAYTDDMSPADALFQAQSKVIHNLASTESCATVGRCAGQVLSDDPNCFRVFVHADKADRLKRIVEEYGISAVDAPEELQKKDAQRANHYKRYTGLTWGQADDYHVSIDSSLLGLDETVEQLLVILEKWQPTLQEVA